MTEVELGELDPSHVRVEVEGCGVCGSNLPVWEGREWFDYPLAPGAPGHESWGRVVATGADVSAVSVGDRVGLLAENAFVDAIDVPASRVVVLPAELGDQPFPGEAIGCGVNAAARARFASGQTVAVIGIGFIGAVITALAAEAGAHVIAVSRRAFSLDVAKTMGAKDVIEMGEPSEVVQQVAELTNGAWCDVVVEAVGSQGPLDVAGRVTRESGRLVIAGFHQDGMRSVDIGMWNWKGLEIVNAHFRDPEVSMEGIRRAAALVAEGRLDPAPLYTHTFPLERLGDAMDAMVERPDGFLKAIVAR